MLDAVVADVGANDLLASGRNQARCRAPLTSDFQDDIVWVHPGGDGLPVFLHAPRAHELGSQPELVIVRHVSLSHSLTPMVAPLRSGRPPYLNSHGIW